MVSEDGKIWRAPWRKLSDLGKPKELGNDEKDSSIVVGFKVYYSSLGMLMPQHTAIRGYLRVE